MPGLIDKMAYFLGKKEDSAQARIDAAQRKKCKETLEDLQDEEETQAQLLNTIITDITEGKRDVS